MRLVWTDTKAHEYFAVQEQRIYIDSQLPAATEKSAPAVYLEVQIQFPVRGWLRRLRKGRVANVSLTYYDPSGEHFESMNDEWYLRLLSKSGAIIAIVDPLRLAMDQHRRTSQRQVDLLVTLIQQLRSRQSAQKTRRLNQLLAVVLTKCDQPGQFHPDDPVHEGRFPVQGRDYDPLLARRISDAVSHQLHCELAMDRLVQVARENFRRVAFFATSALGDPLIAHPEAHAEPSASDELDRAPGPTPRRVEEPLLWILHEWGYL